MRVAAHAAKVDSTTNDCDAYLSFSMAHEDGTDGVVYDVCSTLIEA